MSKKTIKDFASLRSLLKKTETESEAKAAMKGSEISVRKLPRRPVLPEKTPRHMSAVDKFIVDTLDILLDQLSLEQLNDARITIQDAIECAASSQISIQRQIDLNTEDRIDDQGRSWKTRAEAALRFKVREEYDLKKKLVAVDEMILRAKPALKLVTPPPLAPKPVPAPSAPKAAVPYEIRTSVPRPSVRQSSDEWHKYPFDKLETTDHSFRFGPEITASEARRLITAAQRHLGRHFSYRTERDGVVAVWRTDGPSRTKK